MDTRSGLRSRPAAARSSSSTRNLIEPDTIIPPAEAATSGTDLYSNIQSLDSALADDLGLNFGVDTSGSGAFGGGLGSASAGRAEDRARRESFSSVASSDDEYDAGLVHRILTGRVRPPSPISEAAEADAGRHGLGLGPAPHDPANAEPHEQQPSGQHDDQPCCRICFDTEEDDETGTLFSPCKCAGTVSRFRWGSESRCGGACG